MSRQLALKLGPTVDRSFVIVGVLRDSILKFPAPPGPLPASVRDKRAQWIRDEVERRTERALARAGAVEAGALADDAHPDALPWPPVEIPDDDPPPF